MLDPVELCRGRTGSGNANHGPMAAEALFALGRDEADAHQAVRYTWQACAGIYSWYSTTPPQDSASWETPPSPGALRNGIKPSSGDAIRSPDPEGLSEPQETAPEPLTMVAAANGYGSVIDDEDVVSMTVTTSPRRPTFLQQARWYAVQKAELEGMSIRKMARRVGPPQRHRKAIHRCRKSADAPV